MEKRDDQDKGLIERAAFSALMVGASLGELRGKTNFFGPGTEGADLTSSNGVDCLNC